MHDRFDSKSIRGVWKLVSLYFMWIIGNEEKWRMFYFYFYFLLFLYLFININKTIGYELRTSLKGVLDSMELKLLFLDTMLSLDFCFIMSVNHVVVLNAVLSKFKLSIFWVVACFWLIAPMLFMTSLFYFIFYSIFNFWIF